MEFTQLNKGYKTTNMHAAEGGPHSMFITTQGRRFVNEYAARDVFTSAAIENGGTYYCLTNVADARDLSGIYDTYTFNTISEMCDHFDMDVAVVTEEINKYNSYVETGYDPEFGKNVFGGKIIGPYMIRVWVPIVHHTMGGVRINVNTEVLDTQGKVIPGFYAAGEVAGGIHGGNRLGGNAVADAFVFGHLAGKNAASRAGK
jgi:fumarate reductase flavoprotein subunit